jgi:hypothetical protein
MWIFTEFGILMPSLRPAEHVDEDDNRLMQIRTRRRYELDYLREKYMPETLGETIVLGDSDYQFRAYCTIDDWAAASQALAYSIDYTKFKPTTDRHLGGGRLHDLYNSVWGRVLSAFPSGSSYDVKWTRKTTKTTKTKRTVDVVEPEMDWCTIPNGKNTFCLKMDGHSGGCDRITLRK